MVVLCYIGCKVGSTNDMLDVLIKGREIVSVLDVEPSLSQDELLELDTYLSTTTYEDLYIILPDTNSIDIKLKEVLYKNDGITYISLSI